MYQDVWLLLVTCTVMQTVSANWDRVCTPFTRRFGPHPRGICGNRLDSTLDLLCVGGYNEYPSTSNSYFRKKRDTSEEIRSKMDGFLLPREEANSYLSRSKRSAFYSRGIVCECCYHKCNLPELLSYCKDGPTIFGLFKRSTDRQMRLYSQNRAND